ANATRQGMPRRFFAGTPGEIRRATFESFAARPFSLADTTPSRRPDFELYPPLLLAVLAYESPRLSHSVPSSARTRRTSENSARIGSPYSAGEDSSPYCPSLP